MFGINGIIYNLLLCDLCIDANTLLADPSFHLLHFGVPLSIKKMMHELSKIFVKHAEHVGRI